MDSHREEAKIISLGSLNFRVEGNRKFPPKGNPPGKSSTWVSCEDDKSEGVANSMISILCDEEREKSMEYVNRFYEYE